MRTFSSQGAVAVPATLQARWPAGCGFKPSSLIRKTGIHTQNCMNFRGVPVIIRGRGRGTHSRWTSKGGERRYCGGSHRIIGRGRSVQAPRPPRPINVTLTTVWRAIFRSEQEINDEQEISVVQIAQIINFRGRLGHPGRRIFAPPDAADTHFSRGARGKKWHRFSIAERVNYRARRTSLETAPPAPQVPCVLRCWCTR